MNFNKVTLINTQIITASDNLLLVHVIFESPFLSTFIHFIKNSILFIFYKPTTGDMLRGARATGAAGATAPIAQTVRGQHGGPSCPFHWNCTSKFVHYSQELEFITIFKQCLSNICLIFNQLQ